MLGLPITLFDFAQFRLSKHIMKYEMIYEVQRHNVIAFIWIIHLTWIWRRCPVCLNCGSIVMKSNISLFRGYLEGCSVYFNLVFFNSHTFGQLCINIIATAVCQTESQYRYGGFGTWAIVLFRAKINLCC